MSSSTRFAQQDFSLGEFSPRFYGRTNHPYYYRGCRLLENYIPLPQGGVTRRPGTLFCDQLDNNYNYVIHTFIYGDNTTLLTLLSDTDIRLYKVEPSTVFPSLNVQRLLDSAEDEAVFDSPYSSIDDIREVQAFQYQKMIFFSHPDFLLRKLELGEDGDFTFESFVPSYAVWNSDNPYEPGDVVAYDGELFTPNDSIESGGDPPEKGGGWWVEVCDAPAGLGTIYEWSSSSSYSAGDVVIYNSFIWMLRTYSQFLIIAGDPNSEYAPESDDNRLYWCSIGDELPAGITTILLWTESYSFGEGDYAYVETGKIYKSLQEANLNHSTAEAGDWTRIGIAPVMNEPGRYPALVCIHEDRLYFLGSREYPDTIFASRTSRYDEMTLGTDDDDAMSFSLGGPTGQLITWAKSKDGLLLGTGRSEWLVDGSEGGPITPSSHGAYIQSNVGGMRNGAYDIGDMLVFFQAGGRRILRFVYSNDQQSYSTPDMGMYSEHIFSSGVKQMALQTNPDFILWMVMGDGSLVSATYNPSEGIFGWARHETDGEVFSIAVSPTGDGEDDIWLFVKRIVNDAEYPLLEKFAPRRQEDQENWTYLDCAVHLDITDNEIQIENDFHLQTLGILVDGSDHQDITPEGSTPVTVSLNRDGDKAVVGIPFESRIRPQKVVPEDGQVETDIRVARVGLQLYKTLGVEVGANEDEGRMETLNFIPSGATYGVKPEPYTGEYESGIDHDASDPDWILIKQNGPFPGNILGVIYKLKMGRLS